MIIYNPSLVMTSMLLLSTLRKYKTKSGVEIFILINKSMNWPIFKRLQKLSFCKITLIKSCDVKIHDTFHILRKKTFLLNHMTWITSNCLPYRSNWIHPFFRGIRVAQALVFCVFFIDRCLCFFFWPLCCLSFDLQFMINPLISSNLCWHIAAFKWYNIYQL